MSDPTPEEERRPGSLVVVDDEPNVARVLSTYFTRLGWEVRCCSSATEALPAICENPPDVVVTDLSMPEMSGVDLLRELRDRAVHAPLLVITAHGTVDSSVEALKLGAFDYLSKPFDLEKVKLAVQRARLHGQLQRENEHLRQELQARHKLGNLVGSSPKMQEVYALVERAARSRANVLILGESGTGKELVARALHYNGPRANRRFVAVSCAALPSELLESELFGHEKGAFTGANWQRIGRFELADGGTLFLDEIGDISPAVQAKLMRAVQEREIDRVGGAKPIKVDVRIIAATNRDLQQSISRGEFRDDLYYRLRVVEIRLPALRERKEDIAALARHFVTKYARQDGRKIEDLSSTAVEILEEYEWPGNIRELENAIEHAVALADEETRQITPDLLPAHVRLVSRAGQSGGGSRHTLHDRVAEFERRLLLEALDENRWDLDRAAEALGITPQAMRIHVRQHHLSGDRRRPEALG
ncbi:MAG: sigma-54-dependent transcriptional regulator [Armatimonadota bacterium]